MKSKFEWRVNSFDRMGQAGVHSIGMGVLIGLEEWRTDVTMMAYQLALSSEKVLENQIQCKLPSYAYRQKTVVSSRMSS